MDIANKYTNIANQNRKDFKNTFEELLDNGNYNYSVQNGKKTYYADK